MHFFFIIFQLLLEIHFNFAFNKKKEGKKKEMLETEIKNKFVLSKYFLSKYRLRTVEMLKKITKTKVP